MSSSIVTFPNQVPAAITPTTASPIRVALVRHDPHDREALTVAMRSRPRALSLIGSYERAEELLTVIEHTPVDVVVVEVNVHSGGPSLITELLAQAPQVRCVALGSMESAPQVIATVRAGAQGYLLLDESPDRVAEAVIEAAAGKRLVSPRVAGVLFATTRRAPAALVLTAREEELANLLAVGLSSSECAAQMHVGVRTVQSTLKRIFQKVGLSSTEELRIWVARTMAVTTPEVQHLH